jgi:hypothetical protein
MRNLLPAYRRWAAIYSKKRCWGICKAYCVTATVFLFWVCSRLRKDVRRRLLRAAKEGKTITYGHLMKSFGLTRGRGARGVVQVIGEIDDHERSHGGPGFAAMVVRKDTGFPGGGYFCHDGDDLPSGLRRTRNQGTNPRLSRAEKEHVLFEQKAIWNFYGRL